jgi:hypothetical protein
MKEIHSRTSFFNDSALVAAFFLATAAANSDWRYLPYHDSQHKLAASAVSDAPSEDVDGGLDFFDVLPDTLAAVAATPFVGPLAVEAAVGLCRVEATGRDVAAALVVFEAGVLKVLVAVRLGLGLAKDISANSRSAETDGWTEIERQ